MKKLLLFAAVLGFTSFSYNAFAQKEKQEIIEQKEVKEKKDSKKNKNPCKKGIPKEVGNSIKYGMYRYN